MSAPDTRKGAAILLVVFVLDVVAVIAARVIKSRAQQKQGSQRPTLASLYRPGGKS